MDSDFDGPYQSKYARVLSSYMREANALPDTSHQPSPGASEPKTGSSADRPRANQQEQPCVGGGRGGIEGDDDGEGQDESQLDYCPMNENLLPFKLLYVFFGGGSACILPYTTVFLGLLSVSPASVGLLVGLPRLLTALVTPACGVLADRFQLRKAALLACMSLWLLAVLSLNLLPPLRPASCSEVRGRLLEFSRSLPEDSWHFQHLQCMMEESGSNPSSSSSSSFPPSSPSASSSSSSPSSSSSSPSRSSSLHLERGVTNTSSDDKDQAMVRPLLSLFNLPDPFAANRDELAACRPAGGGPRSPAAISHDQPLRENLAGFGDLFRSGPAPRASAAAAANGTAAAGYGWLFGKASLEQSFVRVFVLMGLGEVMRRPTMALTDTAALNELGPHGRDRYGWQRSFGSAGFALYSIVMVFILGIMRFPTVICGLDIKIVDYRIGTVMFGGTVACAFGLLFACCFKFKYYTKAEYRFSNMQPALCSLFYGCVMLTAFVLAVCNGCVNGYLFGHLRTLGATEITFSVILAVRAGSELLLAFHTPRLIGCFGHVKLLGFGLLAYCVRFLFYAYLTIPWLVLPVEVLHGISIALTWNNLVSFLSRAVPMECMATLQGFLSGVYFGLGDGLGVMMSGFLVQSYGAAATFYGFSVALVVYIIFFLLAFKVLEPPRIPPCSYQLLVSRAAPW